MSASPHPRLAERSIRYFLERGEPLPCPEDMPDDFQRTAGAFVSIKVKGALRGCIGAVKPRKKNLAEEIICHAISAATKDPRFPPITSGELDGLTISVDVLSPLEKVNDTTQLDAKVYGLVVVSGNKQGVLLPDLEGVESVEEQLQICRMKAKMKDDDPVEIFRFTVTRHK